MYDQHETARSALLHQQAVMQNLVNTVARNNEAHNDNVQMQVQQLEHEADARFSQRQRHFLPRFSQEANQALEDQREILVTEVTTEVWMRDEQVHELRTELSLHALNSEDDLSRLGFRKHSIERCLKNLELLNQPLDQKLIDFDNEKQNFYEKYESQQ